jgi:hypothetical protein
MLSGIGDIDVGKKEFSTGGLPLIRKPQVTLCPNILTEKRTDLSSCK